MEKRERKGKANLAIEELDLEIKSIDEKTRTIEHRITKEVVDRMGDIVRIDGLGLENFKKKPAVLYGHSYGGEAPAVIGKNVGFRRVGKSLYAKTQFLDASSDDGISQRLKDLINDNWFLQSQKLMGWSIGFNPDWSKTEDIKDKTGNWLGYDFKAAELLEYSSVTIPAHQDAINDAITAGHLSKSFSEEWEKGGEKGAIGEVGEVEVEDVKLKEVSEPEPKAEPEPVEPEIEKTKKPESLDSETIEKFSALIDRIAEKKKKVIEYLTKKIQKENN